MSKDEEIKKICAVCNQEKPLSRFTINGRNGYRRRVCKVCISQKLKMTVPMALDTKVCKACNVEKEIKCFSKQQGIGDGYAARCKKCKLEGNLIPKEKKERIEFRPLTLAAPSIQDYILMYKLMEDIGYSLKEDIHIQFCTKYGLTPNIPKQTFLHYYSQKDLGLI
jgi:hypothetical protein